MLGVVAALYLLLMGMLLAPLWTRHRLSATRLDLHYGLDLNVSIPRAAIVSARPVRKKLTMLEPMRARYDAKKTIVILINLGMMYFAGMLLLIWKLPAMLALVILVLLDIGIIVGMWLFGCARLWRLRYP